MAPKFLFIGENRSQKAQEKDWSWQSVQKGQPRLCAIQLFSALEKVGIDPRKDIKFANIWTDKRRITPGIRQTLRDTPLTIVAMGQSVQKQLDRWDIEDRIDIIHPAARGKIRNPQRYARHIKNKLGSV